MASISFSLGTLIFVFLSHTLNFYIAFIFNILVYTAGVVLFSIYAYESYEFLSFDDLNNNESVNVMNKILAFNLRQD